MRFRWRVETPSNSGSSFRTGTQSFPIRSASYLTGKTSGAKTSDPTELTARAYFDRRSGEAVSQPNGVPVFPAPVRTLRREVAVEQHERMDEMTANRHGAEQFGKLGQPEQPVRVPRCPVRVGAVGDQVDDVVRLGRLVEQVCDAGVIGGHDPIIADGWCTSARPSYRVTRVRLAFGSFVLVIALVLVTGANSAATDFNVDGAQISTVEGIGFSGLVATFTDPLTGTNNYTATIDWGDG